MLKTKRTFDLSTVIQFLHQAFVFTEDVKNVLKSNCDEAMFSIKPWYMEVNNQQEFSQNDCTCPKAETEVEEIAARISRTLLQTQELREKLSSNVMKGRHSKRHSVSKVYNPQTFDNRELKQRKTLNTSNKKLSFNEDTNAVKQNSQKMNLSKGSTSKKVREDIKSNKEMKNYDKQQITRPGKLMATKNFLAINKSNVKNKSEINKHKDNYNVEESSKSSNSMSKLRCISSDDRSSAISTSELKCLIQKVSSKSNNSSSDMHSIKCPSHENIITQSKSEHHFVTVDVVDSINGSNIPGEIIKPLKVYHAYLNIEFSQKSLNNGKRQKTVNKFLMEFDKVDKIIQQQILVQKARDTTLLHKYMSFFQILFSEDEKKTLKSNSIERIYNELQSLWEMFETKEFDSMQILKSNVQKIPLCPGFNLTEWMSNGVWDLSYIRNFKGMSMMCCIRYTSKNNLLFFFELLQQLQYIHYSKNVIDMILKEVLPIMKMFPNSTQLEYVKMYKMIYILYQGLNPKIPVLVSTNE